NCAVNRTGRDTVERNVDAFVLLGICRLVQIRVFIALAVAVVVENKRSPTLRFGFVFGREISLRVEPTLDLTAAGKPERVVVIEIEMVGSKASIDGRDLLCFRIVEFNLTSTLSQRD